MNSKKEKQCLQYGLWVISPQSEKEVREILRGP